MKKIIKSFIYLTMLSFVFIACDEDEVVYDALNYPDDAFVSIDGGSIDTMEANPDEIVVTALLATINQSETVTVGFTVSSENAVLGEDYIIVDNQSQFTFEPGEYSDQLRIKLIDNEDSEENKTITITLTSVSNGATLGFPGEAAFNSSFDINIIDDDCEKDETLRPYEGSYSGTDSCGDYSSEVRLELACLEGILIQGIGHPWLEGDYWGEIVINEFDTYIELDLEAGTINIPEQRYVTTSFGSTISDYFLVGSGTIDTSGASPVLHIEYDMTHPTYGSTALDYGGTSCAGLFVADVSLD